MRRNFGIYGVIPYLAIRSSFDHAHFYWPSSFSPSRLFPAPPAPSTTGVYLIGARRQGSAMNVAQCSALDRCAPLKTLDRVAGFAKKNLFSKEQ
jgi:hypothetical protein